MNIWTSGQVSIQEIQRDCPVWHAKKGGFWNKKKIKGWLFQHSKKKKFDFVKHDSSIHQANLPTCPPPKNACSGLTAPFFSSCPPKPPATVQRRHSRTMRRRPEFAPMFRRTTVHRHPRGAIQPRGRQRGASPSELARRCFAFALGGDSSIILHQHSRDFAFGIRADGFHADFGLPQSYQNRLCWSICPLWKLADTKEMALLGAAGNHWIIGQRARPATQN